MLAQQSHLSDQELLMAVDGELSFSDEGRVQSHLAACWTCRTRKQEIEGAIGEFIRMYRRDFDTQISPSPGRRALLKAQLAQLAEAPRTSLTSWLSRFRAISWAVTGAALAAACAIGVMAYFVSSSWVGGRGGPTVVVTTPNPDLTPGATVIESLQQVCKESSAKNKPVSAVMRRRVFDEYGVRTAEPSAYEVDYLITPALGGADDIHNLWPQSSGGTVWNSLVKDTLEDHMRDMVCAGQLDLATAQHEIAANWIEAYKKYFHTDRPLTGLQ